MLNDRNISYSFVIYETNINLVKVKPSQWLKGFEGLPGGLCYPIATQREGLQVNQVNQINQVNQVKLVLFDISIWNIDCRYMSTHLKNIDIDKDNLENIDIDIDKAILENIDIAIDIDKDNYKNIDIDIDKGI